MYLNILVGKCMFLMQKIIITKHFFRTLIYENIPTILQVYIVKYIWNWECLWKLCIENYATHDEFFNGVDGIFKFVSSLPNNESFICIQFWNSKYMS
jgi:hypothetical protein